MVKWLLLISCLSVLLSGCSRGKSSGEPDTPPGFVKVRRFFHPTERDWVTVGSETSDEQMKSWGYTDRRVQFFAPGEASSETVAVYRWYSQGDGDWVTFREGSPDDATITGWKYTKKTFSFFAYRDPGPGRVAVSRFWSSKDKDWVTIAEDEVDDATMASWGYEKKTPLFYVMSTR